MLKVPNVSHDVAEQGWAFYISRTPRPSWDEVNAHLKTFGLQGVRWRTYRSYMDHDRFEQVRFLGVNEFDMRRKLGLLS
jgi:hypothetical protein